MLLKKKELQWNCKTYNARAPNTLYIHILQQSKHLRLKKENIEGDDCTLDFSATKIIPTDSRQQKIQKWVCVVLKTRVL